MSDILNMDYAYRNIMEVEHLNNKSAKKRIQIFRIFSVMAFQINVIKKHENSRKFLHDLTLIIIFTVNKRY